MHTAGEQEAQPPGLLPSPQHQLAPGISPPLGAAVPEQLLNLFPVKPPKQGGIFHCGENFHGEPPFLLEKQLIF